MNTRSEKTSPEQKLEPPSGGSVSQELTAESVSEQRATSDAKNPPAPSHREYTNSERWLLGLPLTWSASPSQSQEDDWSPSKTKEDDRLSQMDFDAVLSVLREEGKKHARQGRVCVAWGLGLLAFSLLMAKFAHNTYFLSLRGGYFVMMIIGWVVVSDRHKAAAAAIARFDDVRAIGPLAEALGLKDRYTRRTASHALIRLLPRMQASDAIYLGPTQRNSLNRALRGKNSDLILAILQAWEQVGDADAIPEVERLAEGRGKGGSIPKVVVAAKECLPFLRQSAERQQIGAHLLRPADVNVTPSDTLLRAALPHTSTDPSEQLLRPTDAT